MGLGQVLGHRGVRPAPETAYVAGHAPLLVKDLDRCGGDAHIDGLPDERLRHRVVMTLHLDVRVDMHARHLPGRVLVGGLRQGRQRGPLEPQKRLLAAARQLLEGSRVQLLEQPLYSAV